MPICFILVGIFLISYIFGVVSDKFLRSFILVPIATLILLGYLFGDVFVLGISFNIFYFIAFMFLLFKIIANKLFSFADVIIISVIGVLYYLIANDNLSFLLTYKLSNIVKCVLILLSILNFKITKCVSFSISLSSVVSFISAYIGFDNFGFFVIDFSFVIEVFIVSVFLYLFKQFIIGQYVSRGGLKYNVKKNYMCYNSRIFKYVSFSF